MSRLSRRSFLARSAGLGALGAWPGASIALGAAEVRGSAAHVLVVGAGFGGSGCALALRRLAPRLRVTLVDPDPSYLTCPMSNLVLVGLRTIDSITVSRAGLDRAGIRCVRGRVEAIDAHRRRAHLADGAELAYDRLVMAPGIRFLWDKIDGMSEAASTALPHAWEAGVQTRILASQLSSMRQGGVFAITVPAGPMRCPPGPFERASLVAAYLQEHNPRAKVLILDSNNRFPKQQEFSAVWREQYGGMIEWIPVVEGGTVLRVDPGTRTLYTADAEHAVDVANVIPPQAPALLAVQAGVASDHGWCPVDPVTFESTLAAGIHVIGDACIAAPMPKSASAAHAQALACAHAIALLEEHRVPPPPRLDSVCFGMLGGGRALSIHGRFAVEGGVMRQLANTEDQAADFEQEARNAQSWYRTIVADSFGAGRRLSARR